MQGRFRPHRQCETTNLLRYPASISLKISGLLADPAAHRPPIAYRHGDDQTAFTIIVFRLLSKSFKSDAGNSCVYELRQSKTNPEKFHFIM